jgi:hypothetical protein
MKDSTSGLIFALSIIAIGVLVVVGGKLIFDIHYIFTLAVYTLIIGFYFFSLVYNNILILITFLIYLVLSIWTVSLQVHLQTPTNIFNNSAAAALVGSIAGVFLSNLIIYRVIPSIFTNFVGNLWSTIGNRATISALIAFFFGYFLFVYFFGLIYATLFVIQDNAFTKPVQGVFDFFYFSVVTATTLGYGDILPVSKTAKFLVCIEVIMSIALVSVYLGVVIGRVAGEYGARPNLEQPKPSETDASED